MVYKGMFMGMFIDKLLYSTTVRVYIHAYDINSREEHKTIYKYSGLRISGMALSNLSDFTP